MIAEFSDALQENAFELFQDWRLENPDGFFITPKKKDNFLLHHVGCHHIGSPLWDGTVPESRGAQHSTTSSKKTCSTDPNELLKWLADRALTYSICNHCIDTRNEGQLAPSSSAIKRMDGWIADLNEWLETHQDEEETVDDETENFYNEVSQSLQDDKTARQSRLATAPKIPERISTTTTSFRRNPDVVAEVLLRSEGKCESCLHPAPFARASDGTPYLEVHHRIMLSAGGEDTVENAIALCPNCHRAAHYA
jgi:predicted HNH restriction endonuclease